MTEDDYLGFRCPKCLEHIEIELYHAPWDDGEDVEVECTNCKYKLKVRCKCTYEHKLIAEVDGEEYDVSDYYSDEFDAVQYRLNEKEEEEEE